MNNEEKFSVYGDKWWHCTRCFNFDYEAKKGKIEMEYVKEIILLSVLMGLMFIGLYKVSEHGN